ncbi:BcepNY3gp39 [Burkholderia phage BcepNY3]|uniref:BcepNY3gp39 n=1 Tax=Burkholderia phage BcepNY3 TaxID=2881397 RepID=A6N3E7_9CAUD|nr:BcepNY3gp39 [Burkholderia phage BcepNY3]ABR10574.1 BcepNY3gp39 [Burkholderia phage BcepNY3]
MAIRQHVRCRECTRRRALPKVLTLYLRVPRCDCGARNWRPDKHMNQRDNGATRCDCAGYWFPHRRGCLYCHYRRDGTMRMFGDYDFADRNYDPELGWT